jgi:hypothetical protein
MVPAVELLPSKHEALSSNPRTAEEIKRRITSRAVIHFPFFVTKHLRMGNA